MADHQEIQIQFVNATELKPDNKYLIALDQRLFSEQDVRDLMRGLGKMGINNAIALHVPGDPSETMQIIEQEKQD